MTWFYKLVLALFSVLLACTAILWILSKTIKPETVRDYLNSQLTSFTSQKITINGEVNWQLFPRPAIKISHITAGDNAITSPYAMDIENLRLNLKIMPLLHGRFVFSELKIDGLKGKLNTDVLPKLDQRIRVEASIGHTSHEKGQVAIEQFMLSHGTIRLITNKQILLIENLQVGATQFNLSQNSFPFQLKGELTLSTPEATLANAQINFSGNTLIHTPNKANSRPTLLSQTGIKGQLTMSHAKMGSLVIDSLNANTLFKNGVVNFNPMVVTLYHGESMGDMSFDINNQTLALNHTATNLDAGALFDALLQKKLLEGSLDFTLHSLTKLQHVSWPTNTQAKGNLTLRDGKLLSFNLNHVIDAVSDKINLLLLKTPSLTPQNKTNNPFQIEQFENPSVFQGNTPLKQLSMTYTLDNATLKSDPLLLQTERLELKGQSVVNLISSQLNGQLKAQVIFNNDQADGIQKLLGGSFPLVLGGSLTQPTLVPDLAQINSQLTKNWLKDTLKMPVDVLKKQIKQVLQPQ